MTWARVAGAAVVECGIWALLGLVLLGARVIEALEGVVEWLLRDGR